MAKFDFDSLVERRGTDCYKWDLLQSDVLPMWVADMDFKAPEPISKALHKAVDHGVFGYGMDRKQLLKNVVSRMKQLYGWEVEEDWIVVTTGLVSGFFAAANTLCEKGDGYLIQPPVYMPFNSMQESLGYKRQENPLKLVIEGNRVSYEYDHENFTQALNSEGARTKMFLLCNPHNPIGKCFSKDELAAMAGKCLENGTVIVSDEIHSELLLGGSKHVPIATISKEIQDQTITLISPSKTFNIAGLFCGFAIISNPELRTKFKKTVGDMTLHVTSLSMVAAEAAFSGECDEWLGSLCAYLTSNRDHMIATLDQKFPELTTTIPQATYLGWLGFYHYLQNGKVSGEPAEYLLKRGKVFLNTGSAFGTGGQPFARINFGCPRSLLDDGLARLEMALSKAE